MIYRYFIFICIALLQITVSAETLEDIREKVGYESPIHSQRKQDYSDVSITELKANARSYRGKTITAECLFLEIDGRGADYSSKQRRFRFRRSADKYIKFKTRAISQRAKLVNLYYPKGKEKEELLYNLPYKTKVRFYGKVIDTKESELFIDIYDIKRI